MDSEKRIGKIEKNREKRLHLKSFVTSWRKNHSENEMSRWKSEITVIFSYKWWMRQRTAHLQTFFVFYGPKDGVCPFWYIITDFQTDRGKYWRRRNIVGACQIIVDTRMEKSLTKKKQLHFCRKLLTKTVFALLFFVLNSLEQASNRRLRAFEFDNPNQKNCTSTQINARKNINIIHLIKKKY